MALTTANYAFPYPESTDNVQLWTWFKNLADAVDARIKLYEPFTPVMATDATLGTTTSTAYVSALTGTTALTLAFTAKRTSHVIEVGCNMYGSINNMFAYMAFDVTGSGFATYGPLDADAVFKTQGGTGANTETQTATYETVVGGLTVGTVYTVTARHRVGSGTGNFRQRRIIVK